MNLPQERKKKMTFNQISTVRARRIGRLCDVHTKRYKKAVIADTVLLTGYTLVPLLGITAMLFVV